MLDAYIAALSTCSSFDQGNILSGVLGNIETLTKAQAKQIATTYNENYELQGSFGFNGAKPRFYGSGLVDHLNRTTGLKYAVTQEGKIKHKSR